MRIPTLARLAILSLVLPAACATAQSLPLPTASAGTATEPPYADIADLAIAAPMILDATIRSQTQIKGSEAADVAPGLARLYVTADVGALVRGRTGVAPQVGYLVDVATDSRGHLPRLKKQRVLLFARAVAGATDQVQLIAPDAQLFWTPATDARVRQIVQAVLAADSPPVVTGIGNAFHVPGSLPGEGETQIFLTTADSRPVSLSILRRPGEQPRWAVALSEIVDDAAKPPVRDTLLWYRLACALPATLPDASVQSLGPDDAAQARDDYAFVIAQLGACGRARTISGGAGPA